jgi:hypothetical protein
LYRKRTSTYREPNVPKIITISVHTVNRFPLSFNRFQVYSGFCFNRFQVYSGFCFNRFQVYSGFCFNRFQVYSGFGFNRFQVYSGFCFNRFQVYSGFCFNRFQVYLGFGFNRFQVIFKFKMVYCMTLRDEIFWKPGECHFQDTCINWKQWRTIKVVNLVELRLLKLWI